MLTTACITSSSWAAAPAASSSRPGSATSWASKGKAEITLVEKSRTHIWKPLLHEIAAGSMDVGRYELHYQAQGTGTGSSSATAR